MVSKKLNTHEVERYSHFISQVVSKINDSLQRDTYSLEERQTIDTLVNGLQNDTSALRSIDVDHVDALRTSCNNIKSKISSMIHLVYFYVLMTTVLTSIQLQIMQLEEE